MNSQLAVFLLGPRLMDFDTFLPLAMSLKATKQNLDIRFVTFSQRHFEYLRDNRTLMAGVADCGSLHCFPTDTGRSTGRLWNLASGFLRMSWWILRRPRPLLFRGRVFDAGSAARLYMLARLRGGIGIVVVKTRIIESSMLPEQLEEFESKVPLRRRANYVDRLLGRCADFLVRTHDDQDIFTRIHAAEFAKQPDKVLCTGLMSESDIWREFIRKEAARELEALHQAGYVLSRRIYVLLGGKPMQSRWLRSDRSVEDSFRKALDAIFANDPDALVLVRPHPAGMDELFIKEALRQYGPDRIKINLAHPDVQAALAHRLIFTTPTNVMSTLTTGRRIDCIEYTDTYTEPDGVSVPSRRFGITYVNPAAPDFVTKFGALLDNATFDNTVGDLVDPEFFQRNKPDPKGLLRDLGVI